MLFDKLQYNEIYFSPHTKDKMQSSTSNNQDPHYEVVAAVITRTASDGTTEIFCAQRPGPKPGRAANETNYKWEFPGGKIEKGETREQALAREIREEFDTEINVGKDRK